MGAAGARTRRVGYNPVETAVFRMHAFGISVNGAARGMPNGIANPIQETSGTNGGSMFYRYCSRRRVLMYVSSRRYVYCACFLPFARGFMD